MDKSGLEKPDMRIYKRKNKHGLYENCLIIPLKYFGKDIETYTSQSDKLSYLLTILYVHDGREDYETFCESWEYEKLEERIAEYYEKYGRHIDKIIVPPSSTKEAGFDHQSFYDYESIEDLKIDPVDFVFNKYIALHTDCD